MANSFYKDACNVNAMYTPYPPKTKSVNIDDGLDMYIAEKPEDGQLLMPHSIMNEHVAINYRTIYNGYPLFVSGDENVDFTHYSDYERCMNSDTFFADYMQDRKNPSYLNIIKYYGNENLDPYGLARYKMQDFIYLKYYNQIPNNHMVTLRRYTRPCEDHMFGLDIDAKTINEMNNYPDSYVNLATAVTYLGEKAGNKLSDILKFEYGANWEDREGKVESLQSTDGGLAAQMKQAGVNLEPQKIGGSNSATQQLRSIIKFSAMSLGKGVNVSTAMASQNQYEGNAFNQRYGENLYGDLNVVNKVKMRSRGLTFTNNFTLNFEYSLKSLKCVNPKIAMLDILSNFLILTGNYGTFWGGATMYFGNRNIAPQYGDPDKLRNGDYGGYISSLLGDVKSAFQKITGKDENPDKDWLTAGWDGLKNMFSGFAQGLLGNLLGGTIGVAGSAQVPPALLSGAPSGFWHLTVGNPLDPIAVMGNMAVTKTTVEFGNSLGYDDFPTEIKFSVDMEHCRPRENSGIESMFNGGKGRFYSFTSSEILNAYNKIDTLKNFKGNENMENQEINAKNNIHNGTTVSTSNKHGSVQNNFLKTIGGMLNG